MYQKHVSKGPLSYRYLKVRLEFEKESAKIEIAVFKHIIVQAIQSLFGELATGNQVDILKYDSNKNEAIIRVHQSFFVKLWSALTLFGSYDGQACVFRVIQVSSHLMGLAASSRQWEIHTKS